MKDDLSSYYDSQEFKDLLKSYEEMSESGHTIYLDGMDIANIAEYYRLTGHSDESETAIAYGLELHPGDTDILMAKASNLLSKGHSDQARAIADSIHETDNSELYFLKGNIELYDLNPLLAQTYYEFAVQANEGDNGLLSDIISQFIDNRWYDYAQHWLNKALSEDPESRNFLEMQADVYFDTQAYDLAIDLYNRLLDDFAYDVYYWEQLAQIYMVQGNTEKLIECCDFIEAIDSNDKMATTIRVHALVTAEEYEKATVLLKELLEKEPDSGTYNYYYGCCLSADPQTIQQALDHMEKALKLLHESDTYQLYSAALLRAAQLESASGKNKESLKHLNELLRDNPYNIEVLLHKAHVQLMLINPEAALRTFRKVVSLCNDKELDDVYHHIMNLVSVDEKAEAYLLMRALLSRKGTDLGKYTVVLPIYVVSCLIFKDRYNFRKAFKAACKYVPDRLGQILEMPADQLGTAITADDVWDRHNGMDTDVKPTTDKETGSSDTSNIIDEH